jgi:arsenite methyltransferase
LGTFIKKESDINNPEIISVLDELPLWSAPFCLKLLDFIEYKKNICALDIGFGTGIPLLEIAQRLGNTCRIFGIDPWDAAIERCKKKIDIYGITNVNLFKGVAENLPFENNFFSLIVSNNGLNNVDNAQEALLECYRVCKQNAQLVFTYNLPDTMKEFYEVFIDVLGDLNLTTEIQKVKDHIFQKRKPLEYTQDQITRAGFKVSRVSEDCFSYKYADGTSMLNHFFIRLAFSYPWEKLLPDNRVNEVFSSIEDRLNLLAEKDKGIQLTIPFACIESIKQ